MALSQISVFLSHSSEDKALAESLGSLFRKALQLRAGEIRITSADGYRLHGGDKTDEALRREIVEADIFVALITPLSIRSQYVLFELGARWGCGRRLTPLLAGGTIARTLGSPLASLMCLDAGNEAQLMQLINELAKELAVECEESHVLVHDVREVANLARTKTPSSSEVRSVCRDWATEYADPDRGDLQVLPEFPGPRDEILAFAGTNDYEVDAWIAITSSDIAWKTPLQVRMNRLGWAELALATITSSNERDQITIRKADGKTDRIDLSWAAYDASEIGKLLRKIKDKCASALAR
jgi:hypothetical protein